MLRTVFRYDQSMLDRFAACPDATNYPSSDPLTTREAEIPGFPSRLKCANPNCEFLAHQDTHMFGNFCCLRCSQSQSKKRRRRGNNREKHGHHCERLLHERVLTSDIPRPEPGIVHLADNDGRDYDDLHYNISWDQTRRCSNPKCPFIRHRDPNAPKWLGTFCCLTGFESRCRRHGPECTKQMAPYGTLYDYYVVRPSYGIKTREMENARASSSYNPAPVMRQQDGSEGIWDEDERRSSSSEQCELLAPTKSRVVAKAKAERREPPAPPPPRHRPRPHTAPPTPRGSVRGTMSNPELTRRLREAAEVERAMRESDSS